MVEVPCCASEVAVLCRFWSSGFMAGKSSTCEKKCHKHQHLQRDSHAQPVKMHQKLQKKCTCVQIKDWHIPGVFYQQAWGKTLQPK